MTKVVNKRVEPFDVYIGRGSKWGNPFVMRNEADRARVIEAYRKFLWQEIKAGRISKDELLALDRKRLGCFCAPVLIPLNSGLAWSSKVEKTLA